MNCVGNGTLQQRKILDQLEAGGPSRLIRPLRQLRSQAERRNLERSSGFATACQIHHYDCVPTARQISVVGAWGAD